MSSKSSDKALFPLQDVLMEIEKYPFSCSILVVLGTPFSPTCFGKKLKRVHENLSSWRAASVCAKHVRQKTAY